MLAQISCPACQYQVVHPRRGHGQTPSLCQLPIPLSFAGKVRYGAPSRREPAAGVRPGLPKDHARRRGAGDQVQLPALQGAAGSSFHRGRHEETLYRLWTAVAGAGAPPPPRGPGSAAHSLNKTMLAADEGLPAAPPIKYNCPSCKKPLESPASEAGVKKPCPACGQRHQVPAALRAPAQPEQDHAGRRRQRASAGRRSARLHDAHGWPGARLRRRPLAV